MEFLKYQHIERYGNNLVNGITNGVCYIFPKIDGTNSSIWLENGEICAGSRNRKLSLDNDNQGFYNSIINDEKIKDFLIKNPNLRLYGEWLVPHSLKTYDDTAWRKFYVFDVCIGDELNYLHYDEYSKLLDEFDIDYIKPIGVITNPTEDNLIECLRLNTYLITDNGIGEGIVIKNYDFKDHGGHTKWAKIISSEFLEVSHRKIPKKSNPDGFEIEQDITDKFVTTALIEKEYAKIINENNGIFENKLIPKVLNTVYYCLITEELWDILKKYKNPKINFKVLKNKVFDKARPIILNK